LNETGNKPAALCGSAMEAAWRLAARRVVMVSS